jgi:hypothetical protein
MGHFYAGLENHLFVASKGWFEKLKKRYTLHNIKFQGEQPRQMRWHCIRKSYQLGPSFGKIKGVLRGLKFQKNVSPFMCAAIYQGA